MTKLKLIFLLFLLIPASYSDNTFATLTAGTVKLLDIDPENRESVKFVKGFKVSNGVIFFSNGNEDSGSEIWSQLNGESEITKVFGGNDFSTHEFNVHMPWDNDKILFWVNNLSSWYVTDGTTEGTRAFTEIQTIENKGVLGRHALTFVGTNSDGNVSIIYGNKGYRYNTAIGTIDEISNNLSFSEDDVEAVIGNSLFYNRLGDLYVVDLTTMEQDLVLEDSNNGGRSGIDYHDPEFSNPTQMTSSNRRYYQLRLMKDSALQKEAFLNIESADGYSLSWVKETGELFPIPILSETPFVEKNIIHDGKVMYAQTYLSGNTRIVKIDLETFEFELLELDPLPGSLCAFYLGYDPIAISNDGVFIRTVSECFGKRIHQLVLIQNDGDVQYLTDETGALDAYFELYFVSEEKLVFTATYEDNSEFWELNLNTLTLNRVPTPNFTASIEYALNGQFYIQYFNRLINLDNPIEFIYRINFEKGVYGPFHTFDFALTSSSIVHDTIELENDLVFSYAASAPTNQVNFLKLSDDGQLVNISTMEERSGLVFFSKPSMEKAVITYRNSSNAIISTYDILTAQEGVPVELPVLEDGSYFVGITNEINGKLLIVYNSLNSNGQKFNYAVFDTYEHSLSFFETDAETDFSNAQVCADSLVYVGESSIYVDSDSTQVTTYDLPPIVSSAFTEDGFLALATFEVTESGDIFTADSGLEGIYSYNCVTKELTQHIQYNYPPGNYYSPQITKGIAGRFFLEGRTEQNIEINASSGETLSFPNVDTLIDDMRYSRIVDTEYGLYAFVSNQGEVIEEQRIYQTFVYREVDNNFVLVNQFNGEFFYSTSSKYDPYGRLFNISTETGGSSLFDENQRNGGDIAYFTPGDDTFGYIDLIPGNGLVNYVKPHFSKDGLLYLGAPGHLGADIYIINLNCSDLANKATCSNALENSPPQILGPDMYSFTLGQNLYIPIRLIDEDREVLSISTSNLPEWLTLESNIIKGQVPNDFESDSVHITITTEDQAKETTTRDLILVSENPVVLQNLFSVLEAVPDEVTSPTQPTQPSSNGESSGGGVINLWFLLLLPLFFYKTKLKETRYI